MTALTDKANYLMNVSLSEITDIARG